MAKGSRGGKRTNTPTTAQATQTVNSKTKISFTTLTNQQASQRRDELDDIYDPDTIGAIKAYISNAPDAQGYSLSQNMNYKLENGLKLNASEQFTDRFLQKGMADLGKDTVLYRGAHEDFLQRLGIKNYQSMTESELKSALVGAEYQTKSYTSASYDKSKNPFYTGAAAGGREVEMIINAPKTTKMVFGARAQTEIVINKGTKYRVTDVKYTNRTATPRNSGSKKVVQVEVEVI